MRHLPNGNVRINTSIIKQNIHVALDQQTPGCQMSKEDPAHDYKFAKALQESLAQDIEHKKDLFKNAEDIEIAKQIIRGQV